MTPEEKAKYLISINSVTILSEIGNKLTMYEVTKIAKQCALIAVDEMNKVYESLDEDSDLIFKKELKYLYEVKQEIENYEF